MHIVGELRDKKLIEQMRDELFSKGISANSHYNQKDDVYYLTVDELHEVGPAQEYYRVKLGIKKPIEIDEEWVKIKSLPRGKITYTIVVVCIVLYLMSLGDGGKKLFDLLFMGNPASDFLMEIKSGQIWRILTPVFLHLSFFHILFNMLWFKDLGYLIEYKFGKNQLLLLIGISGVISNFSQYLVSGPSFGGMSGVLYAMLGFIWVYKSVHTTFDYSLPARDITIMVGWLLLCLTGFLGPIANTAHASGLFVGMLYALILAPEKWGKKHVRYFFMAVLFLTFTVGVEGIKLGGRYFVRLWF